jgi:hypothetical protein
MRFEAEPLTDDCKAIAVLKKFINCLCALQREAIAAALSHSVCVITAPRTGKRRF